MFFTQHQKVSAKYELPVPYIFPEYCQDKIIKGLEMSRSHHHIAQLHPQTFSLQVQTSMTYGSRDTVYGRFQRGGSFLKSRNILHLTVCSGLQLYGNTIISLIKFTDETFLLWYIIAVEL